MHDLELFFWVLCWICIHYNGRNEKGEVKQRVVPKYEKHLEPNSAHEVQEQVVRNLFRRTTCSEI